MAKFLLAREARILRLRLEFGLVELEEIEHWADATLLAMTNAPHELVELSKAKASGVSEALRALVSIGGNVCEPSDVLLAVATAETASMGPQQLEHLLGDVARWAKSFSDVHMPDAKLLFDAYRPGDELFHALTGNRVPIERAIVSARAYLSRIRDWAVGFHEPFGGHA